MNYIGSKYSLLDFFRNNYCRCNPDIIMAIIYILLIYFPGTGIVGQTYKAKGCSVISNDIQYYSYVLSKHYIENTPEFEFRAFVIF